MHDIIFMEVVETQERLVKYSEGCIFIDLFVG